MFLENESLRALCVQNLRRLSALCAEELDTMRFLFFRQIQSSLGIGVGADAEAAAGEEGAGGTRAEGTTDDLSQT